MAQIKETTVGTKQNLTPTPVVEASNDPYATGNPVYESPAVTINTDMQGNVPPLGGVPPTAVVSPPITTPIPTNAQEAARRGETGVIGNVAPQQIDPQTGFVMGSPEDTAAKNAGTQTAPGMANPISYTDNSAYYDTANNAINKVYEYADIVKAQQDAAKLKLDAQQAQQDRLNGSSAGGGNNVNTSGGVGTAPIPVGTGGGGTTSSTSAPSSGQPAKTFADYGGGASIQQGVSEGDALVKQAVDSKFTWDATTDPDYKIAAANAENEVAQMMVGRGGLWSSVTQNALTNKLFVLQADYRKQAYANYVDNRNFLMQVAQIKYGREDAAWDKNYKIANFNAEREDAQWTKEMESAKFAVAQANTAWEQNMQILSFNAQREDESFSRSMQQQNLALSKSNAAFNQKMQEAQQKQANIAPKLNMEIGNYTVASNNYSSMKSAWEKSGSASQEVANFFGVVPGTPITSTSGANAVSRKATTLSNTYDTLMSTAYNYDQDAAYLAGLNNFVGDTSVDPFKTQDIMQLGSTSQASAYQDIKNQALAPGVTSSDIGTLIQSMFNNSSSDIQKMGPDLYSRLYSELEALQAKKASQE